MGRKHLLDHLLTSSDSAPASPAPQRRPTGRGVGVIGAMSESIESIEADLKEAKERIETGDLVVEIPTDLIDPSFITERIGEDAEMEEFIASIRDHGQRTPILLRPHPEHPDRYQIAFGHRRYRAQKALGRPVKALIKPLSDTELVIAQGQENRSRLDLSFIERATFAARLEARGFQRDVICSALNIDKTEASRMIGVATGLPDDLIRSIGPANNTGRRKWMELAKAVEVLDWETEKDRLLAVCGDAGPSSDEKFEAVLRAVIGRKTPAQPGNETQREPRFKVDKRPGLIRIRFDETSLPADVIDECLARVRDVCSSFGVRS